LKKDAETLVETLASQAAGEMGLILVAVEVRPGIVRVFVDGEGGVTVRECEALSRKMNEALDSREDSLPGPYVLEVSSPGLDRVLASTRERRWAIGKRVRASLRDGHVVEGRLTAAGPDLVVVDDHEIGLDALAKLSLNEV